MFPHVWGFTRTWSAVILAAGAIACNGSPTQPSGDAQVRVTGSVTDFHTNAAAGGALVAIGSATATTDASGRYVLTSPPGEQRVSVDGESLGVVNLKDQTYRGDFYVHAAGCIARYGSIVNKRTRRPVAGAAVSVAGMHGTTDQSGWFYLSLGCPGTLCNGFNTTFLSVTRAGYLDGSFVVGRGVCRVERVDYELEPR
jgi:hypothetical protein